MKKNITAIFLVIAIMFGNIFMLPVSAAEPLTIKIGDADGKVGANVSIDVSITGNSGITGYMLDLKYDESILEYTGYVDGGLFDGKELVSSIGPKTDETDSNLKIVSVISGNKEDVTPVNGDGILCTLNFKIKEESTEGESTLIEVANTTSVIETKVAGEEIDFITTPIGNSIPGTVVILGENDKGTIKIGTDTGKPGEKAIVPVTTVGEMTIAGYMLKIKYDAEVLTLEVDETKASATPYGDVNIITTVATPTDLEENATIITVHYDEETDEAAGGAQDVTIGAESPLFDLVFTINEDAVAGEYSVTLNEGSAVMAEENSDLFTLNGIPGSVTVEDAAEPTGRKIELIDGEIPAGYVIRDMGDLGWVLKVPGEATQEGTLAFLKEVAEHTFEVNIGSVTAVANSEGKDFIGTGMVIELKNSNNILVDFVTVIKYGDVLGTGDIGPAEALRTFRNMVNPLSGVYLEAACVLGKDENGEVDPAGAEALAIFRFGVRDGGIGVFTYVEY